VLAELVNRVGNVGTCESDILQSTDDVAIFEGNGEHFTSNLDILEPAVHGVRYGLESDIATQVRRSCMYLDCRR
jgi:hypothetical protein